MAGESEPVLDDLSRDILTILVDGGPGGLSPGEITTLLTRLGHEFTTIDDVERLVDAFQLLRTAGFTVRQPGEITVTLHAHPRRAAEVVHIAQDRRTEWRVFAHDVAHPEGPIADEVTRSGYTTRQRQILATLWQDTELSVKDITARLTSTGPTDRAHGIDADVTALGRNGVISARMPPGHHYPRRIRHRLTDIGEMHAWSLDRHTDGDGGGRRR